MTAIRTPIDQLQETLAHRFKRLELLEQALTHRSAVAGRHPRRGRARTIVARDTESNERLEFVGDRVLGLLMAEWLLEYFPNEPEGGLGPRHAHLVSRTALAGIAETIGLPVALRIATHEEQAGIRQLANVLADALEAVLGALYLDAGLGPARGFVRRYWHDLMTGQIDPPKDPKTALQEWALGKNAILPVYETLSMEGPSHAPRFTVAVTALNQRGEGVAGSKRLAESAAAADLLAKLNRRSVRTPKEKT
ncbi:ribonuclease III [Neoasaia chiangmaiensis NBRC 101099]|uniref:Ribonuclease 3 n=1 Tax=Neoasaia chiangmaiensis TaxID=320497 RepID=A0A1U9KRI3_9PROT|nr:ribonuclease III [Neoasaia chiangmaiensis]AQS88349.1 ribonuclease III [Neoasaia chiangmaiensis]GBR39473.1 ribonuclease III [Neoasaia chiangmaiensis NBRC 101099]GEN14597.1 ribonuclease 3 [Neoasaia chiangmaiensis]